MRDNLLLSGGLIMSEAFMLLLAKASGRKVWAHQLCHDIAMEAGRSKRPITELLVARPEITRYLSPQQIVAAFNPMNYIGTAVSQVEDTVAQCRRRRRESEKILRETLWAGTARDERDKRRTAR
jgi:adenylosuccinate lyase